MIWIENCTKQKSRKKSTVQGCSIKKHTFYLIEIFRTGLGGTGSEEDVICVLPLNMINQKFFSIFYLWLAFLFVLTLVSLTIKLCLIFSKESREMVLLFVYRIKSVNVSSYLNRLRFAKLRCNYSDVFACFFALLENSFERDFTWRLALACLPLRQHESDCGLSIH